MIKTNQSHNHNSLPPYPVIEAATKGNADAMCAIVKHYEGYIAALCTRMAFDDNGVPLTRGKELPGQSAKQPRSHYLITVHVHS